VDRGESTVAAAALAVDGSEAAVSSSLALDRVQLVALARDVAQAEDLDAEHWQGRACRARLRRTGSE
jgi:hypothetical protein